MYDGGEPPSPPISKIGDTVRISKCKRKTFDKGYSPNWTEEVFIIDKIQLTNPIMYKIRDQNGELFKGTHITDKKIIKKPRVIPQTKPLSKRLKDKKKPIPAPRTKKLPKPAPRTNIIKKGRALKNHV